MDELLPGKVAPKLKGNGGKPAVYRPPRSKRRSSDESGSPRNWRNLRTKAIKTIEKSRKQNNTTGTGRLGSPTNSDKLAWDLLRVTRGTLGAKYDFAFAMKDRKLRKQDVRKDVLADADVLFREHKWTKPHVPLNILLDVQSIDRARVILKCAEKDNRNIFGRGSVGLNAQVLSEAEKARRFGCRQKRISESFRMKDKSDIEG